MTKRMPLSPAKEDPQRSAREVILQSRPSAQKHISLHGIVPTLVFHIAKYPITAVVQKNPEQNGDQLLSELEWKYVRTSGGERNVGRWNTHLRCPACHYHAAPWLSSVSFTCF